MMTTTAELNHPLQDDGVAKTASLTSEREPKGNVPFELRKRIGSTVYLVKVRYNPTATETLEDKLFRLIEGEVNELA